MILSREANGAASKLVRVLSQTPTIQSHQREASANFNSRRNWYGGLTNPCRVAITVFTPASRAGRAAQIAAVALWQCTTSGAERLKARYKERIREKNEPGGWSVTS